MQANRQPTAPGMIAVGVVLIGVGAIVMLAQAANITWPTEAWPFAIIIPGATLLLAGLATGREPGLGMTIAGSIVTTVGLILLWQATTDTYSSWAYAWALLPTAAGVGTILHGLLNGDREAVGNGTNTALIGAGMFAVGLVVFEGIIGLDGRRSELLSGLVAPAIIVGIGALLLVKALFFGPGRDEARQP